MSLLKKVKGCLKYIEGEEGQAVIETVLVIPILLLLIAGIVELGVAANEYMTFHDAAREGARFGASLDPELTSQYPFDMRDGNEPFPDVRALEPEQLRNICDQGETTNFYYEVVCLTFQNIPLGELDPEVGDDIVITVVGVDDGDIAFRWPITSTSPSESHAHPNDWGYHFRGTNDGDTNPSCTVDTPENCRCWSLYGNHGSEMFNSDIEEALLSEAPNTAFVVVEVFHSIPHFTGLFTIGDYIPDPIPTRPYAIFPVSAAEPRD